MKDAQLEEDLQALAKAFLLLKTEEECIACGSCGIMCPDGAINIYRVE